MNCFLWSLACSYTAEYSLYMDSRYPRPFSRMKSFTPYRKVPVVSTVRILSEVWCPSYVTRLISFRVDDPIKFHTIWAGAYMGKKFREVIFPLLTHLYAPIKVVHMAVGIGVTPLLSRCPFSILSSITPAMRCLCGCQHLLMRASTTGSPTPSKTGCHNSLGVSTITEALPHYSPPTIVGSPSEYQKFLKSNTSMVKSGSTHITKIAL